MDAAASAHQDMHGYMFRGHTLRVGWGKPDVHGTAAPKETGPPPCRNLWLGNVAPSVTEVCVSWVL